MTAVSGNLDRARRLNRIAIAVTILVWIIVGMMRQYKIQTSLDFSFLPAFHSSINIITSIVLLIALFFIRRKNIEAHRKSIYTALILSGIFLVSYVLYHITSVEVSYCREGAIRYLYYFILITHIVLAGVMLPFILFTFIRAYTGQYRRHKKMARWVWPFWFYITISGPIVYFMLLPCH